MNVLMTADTVGGVWTYALELAAGLSARGVRVALATKGALPSGAQREAAARVPGLELFESQWRLEWMADPWDHVARASEWLLELAASLRPDVVHLNDFAHGTLPLPAPKLVVAHSCVCTWWRAVHGVDAPAEWEPYRKLVSRGLRGADAVVAPSSSMLLGLHQQYGPLQEVRVVHHGRDPDAFAPARKEPMIVGAGRLWDEAKNLSALAAVAPRLPWPVLLAGDAGDRRLQGVELLGRLSQGALAALLARAAIYAHPAKYEPFGLGVLEAALSGCALVLGDIPSQRELWDGAAVFVDPKDGDALGEQITALIEDAPLRARLAQTARERALNRDTTAMTQGYLAVYRELTTRSSAQQEGTCAS